MDLEQEMQDLSDSASLFEVNLPEYKLLRQSRREIKMLKTLWDYIFIGKCMFMRAFFVFGIVLERDSAPGCAVPGLPLLLSVRAHGRRPGLLT